MKILVVFGTRPEAIKMAPVVLQLRRDPRFRVAVCVTAQHREMLDQVLGLFSIVPEYDLDLMKPGQSLSELTARVLTDIGPVFDDFGPDCVLVHGDTSTTLAATLAAYYRRIDVGHVEAGLRTGNIYSPWPEEVNRRFTALIARYHFAPTEIAAANLRAEGISPEQIRVTGNTVIDALLTTKGLLDMDSVQRDALTNQFPFVSSGNPLVLITGHRRENFGRGFESICCAISQLAARFAQVQFVYPVHLNPNVQEPVCRLLSGRPNIHLIAPQDYLPFVFLMDRATLILTDSGGIQEEGPALGRPVLVMRDTTERPEAIAAGTAALVGTETDKIVATVSQLLTDDKCYRRMATAANPYGDGSASKLIVDFLAQQLQA